MSEKCQEATSQLSPKDPLRAELCHSGPGRRRSCLRLWHWHWIITQASKIEHNISSITIII